MWKSELNMQMNVNAWSCAMESCSGTSDADNEDEPFHLVVCFALWLVGTCLT